MARGVISRRGNLQNNSLTKKTGLLAAAVAGVFATGVLSARPAQAGTFTWDTSKSGNWSDAANWLGGIAPTGADNTDQLTFGGSGATGYTSSVDAFVNPWIINALILNSSATVAETINNTNTAGFQLGGTSPLITQNGSGAFNISSPIALGAATTLMGSGTGLTTLSGVISGSNSLNVTGGTWRLTNAGNSWSGGTNITGGVLELFSNGADLSAAATGNTRIGAGGSININATTPGGAAELRFTSGLGKTLGGVNSKPIIFGANGGLVNIDGSIAAGAFAITTSTAAGASPAVFRFNGGPNHLSNNSPTNGDWTNGNNALRLAITNAGPIRVELNQGAMFVAPNVATLANPLTIRGVLGGDPSSGPNGTLHTGITQSAGRFDLPNQPTYTYTGGLTLQDSLLVAQEGAARAIKGNITIAGTASGHAGNVGFFGRSTGTALGPTLQLPGQNAVGLNPLYIGNSFDANDSLTIQDGGIAALDLRVRSDQNNHNGVLLNAKTIINAGGKLVFRQSLSAQTPGLNPAPTAAPVGYHIVQGNITGEGTTAKESLIDLYMPGDNTVGDGATTGGIDWQATSNIIVNGSGIGGLRVNGLTRPSALFGGGGNTDPDANNVKVEAFLTPTRLAALSGSGGYLTPAPVDSTFTMGDGSDWAPGVTVGLKVVNSNTLGADVALGGNFTHNILIDSGATLNADQRTLGPAAVTAGIGRVWGTGTIVGNATIDMGGRIAPGNSVGAMAAANDLTINGTYEVEVSDPISDLLSVGGNLTLGASSVLDLPVSNTYGYSPYTIATYGSLNGTFGSVTGLPAVYAVDYSNGQIRLVFIAAQQKTWAGSDGLHPTFWDNNTTSNWNAGAAKYVDANHDNVTFDDSASSSNVVVTGGNVNPSSILITNDALNYTITSSAGNAIAGTTGLEKRGNAKLTLSGPNSFIGPVRVKRGIVSVNQLSDSGVAGPLGAGSQIVLADPGDGGEVTLQYTGAADGSTNRSVTINNPGAVFDVTNNVTATYSGVVSGDGTITKRGAGTAALSNAANTITNQISVEQGTLRLGSMGAGTAPIVLGLGANAGTLDYSGATFSDNRGITVNTTGTVRVSNAATNLTLNGGVSGPTINKSGPGTLTLSGLVSLSDASHTVAQGTLSLTNSNNNIAAGSNISVPGGATLQSRPGAIGGANVRLSGGTFRVSADDAGLFGEFFQTAPGLITPDNTGVNAGGSSIYNTAGGINTFLATLSPAATANTSATGTPLAFPPNSAGNNNPLAPWQVSIGNDYVTGRWKGKINAPSTGQYTFYLASDDGSVMFIDGVKVVDLNRLAGYSETTGTPVTLSAGVHDIMIAWYENAGGAGIDASWLPPGGVKGNLPNNILLAPQANATAAFGNNSVQVLSDSTIDNANTNNAMFAGLTMAPGITLTHSGIGASRFATTTLSGGAATTYNFNVTGGILDLGQLNNTASRIINKSGAGNLVLGTNGAAGLAAGSSLNISGGNVVAVGQAGSPAVLGNAPVALNAGATGLIISSKGGNLDFNNTIAANENVRIAASASDGGVSGPITVNLNSPITVSGGKTVTLAADDAYTLNVVGAINGSAGITVAAGDGLVDLSTSQSTGTLRVNAGTARFSAPQTATVATIVGGFGNNNYAVANGQAPLTTPLLTIGNRGTYNANIASAIAGPVSVNTGGTLNANVANALSGATVTASGGNAQFWVDGAIGTGSVTLSNNGSITGRVADGDPQNVRTLPTFSVAAGQTGNLVADRDGASSNLPGLVMAPTANLGAGSTLNLVTNNAAQLRAQNVNLGGGNATLNNIATASVAVGNITGAGTNLSVLGASRTRITGNISAANMLINGSAVELDPGTGNTTTVASPIQVNTELKALSGTVNIGDNVITGDATRTVPGLKAQFYQVAASEMTGTPTPAQTKFATLSALNAAYTDTAPVAPFVANTTLVPSLTWAFIADTAGDPPGATFGNMGFTGINNYVAVFRGQILLNSASTTFFTNSDDATMVYLAGNNTPLVDNNGNHGAQARNGTTTLTGWQDVVLGYYAATGTDGARFAIGADADANAITNAILRTPSATGIMGGTLNIEPGVAVNAGGIDTLGTINLNGTGSAASLSLSKSTPHSGTVSVVNVTSSGVVSLGANNTLNVETLNVPDGAIFEKEGAGTLRTTIAHNLGNGATVGVSGGKLLLNGAGTGTGTVIVRSGGTLGGSGTLAGSANVQSGGHVAPGASVGTLTAGGLDFAGGSFLDIEGNATGLDKLKIASDGNSDVFTLNGVTTINLFDLGGVATGDYVIIDYNNTNPIADALSHLTLSNPNGFAGLAASLINDTANKDIVLRLSGDNQPPQWNVDGNGSWGVASNWLLPTVPDNPTAIANFLGKITAPRTVTLDGNRIVQSLNFDNANKYTIAGGSGGTLTIGNGTSGAITVTSGTHEISANLAFAGTVTKSGPGTLTISGAQSHAAGAALNVNSGRVNLNSNAGTAGSAAASNLSLSIGGGAASVVIGSNQDLKALNVSFGDAGTQTLDLASAAGAGAFNAINVYAADLAGAKAALYSAMVNANKAGAADPLDGIIDSGKHAGSAIGIATSGDHVTIRSTRVGDLNLDGSVTISDFIDLASNFNALGKTWQEGDLNYDGSVTISDFIDLASNFNGSYSGTGTALNGDDVQTLASFASSIGVDPSVIGSAVPEPGTIGVLAVGALGLMGRRRRRN